MFNKIIFLLVRSITETLKCLNFLIAFIMTIGVTYSGKNDFKIIAISGVILYILTTLSIKFFSNNNNKSFKKNIVFFASLAINLSIAFIIINSIFWEYKVYCMIYFFIIILYATIHYNNDVEDMNHFIKMYIYSVIITLFVMFLIQGGDYKEVVKIYTLYYLIMSVIYIIQVNLLQEYNYCDGILVNEDKNIRRFNIMSAIITVSTSVLFITDLFKKGYNLFIYVIENITYMMMKCLGFIMIFLYEIGIDENKARELARQSEEKTNKNIIKGEKQDELIMEMMNKEGYSSTSITVAKVVIFIIMLIIIGTIIYLVYKKINNIKINAINMEELDGEERSFVFKKDKNGKAKRKKINLKDLHVIRQIYIEVIKTLKRRGIEYKNSYTPNEYNSFIGSTEYKSKDIDKLTNIYNGLRYGNKAISKDDIDIAYKIKENL